MVKSYAAWILRWRFLVLLVCVILVGLAASGGRFLTFKTDYRVFFSEDNPQLRAFEELQNTYTKADNVLFALAPKDGKVFTPDTLEAVRWLTNAAWQIPYSLRVDSLTNYQHTRAEGDDLIVADLVEDPAALDQSQLQDISDIALNEPLLLNRLISPDASVTGVNVTIQLPDEGSGAEVPEITAFARDLVRQVKDLHPDIDVYLTGMVIMNNSFPEVSVRDQQTLIPIMFMIVLVTLAFLLRSLSSMIGTFIVIVFSILTAMGLAGWLGMGLTPPSASSPPIILTLAVADCVHFLVTFLHAMRKGMDRHSAIVESLRINMQPIFLTSLTTVIGFMSMNFSDAPPFRDLGNIVAMGVAAAFVFSVTFLPALMAILPVRVKTGAARHSGRIDRFADFVVARQNSLFWISGVVIILLVAFIPRNELNDEFVKYFDDSIPFRTATEFASENLTGIYTIDYSLGNGEVGGINEPAFLAIVDRFTSWYRRQPKIAHVFTLTDTMKRLNRNMHGDDPAFYRLPEQRDLAAQYLLLYEMSLPFGLDLNKQINVDKSAIRIVVRMKEASTRELRTMDKRAQDWLRQNAPPAMFNDGTGLSVVFAHISERNIKSMLGASFGALVLISGILIVSLRSVKFGLLSLIPNLAPAFMAFGIWGLTVGQVGLVISILAALTLGIVVDDTVHFMSKYLRARREYGMAAPDAVRYSYNTVGTAMWITSVVLVAGFLVLALSGFEINSDMGLMTALTIILALLLDFLFLPILLMKMDGLEKSPMQ